MNSTAMLTRDNGPKTPPWAFRRAQLNAAGWAAVLAPGWLAGIALAVATSGGKPSLGRVLGCAAGSALGGALLARGIDEAVWRRREVLMEVEESDAALDLMQAVRAEGVRAEMVRADTVRWNAVRAHHVHVGATHSGKVGPESGVPDNATSHPAYAVRYRAKDDRRVRAVLAEQQR